MAILPKAFSVGNWLTGLTVTEKSPGDDVVTGAAVIDSDGNGGRAIGVEDGRKGD